MFYFRGSNSTSVEDDVSFNDIILYPNPVKDILNIASTVEYYEIDVYDLTGKKHFTTGDRIIDVSFLNSGAYIVRVKDKNGVVIKAVKILKQ